MKTLTDNLKKRAIESNAVFCVENDCIDDDGNIYTEKEYFFKETQWALNSQFTDSEIRKIRKDVKVNEWWEKEGREKYIKENS